MTVRGGHRVGLSSRVPWPERRTGGRRATVCRHADTASITIGDVTVTPRFTMVVLLVADLPRSLAFYRRLGVEFPVGAESRTDVQVPLGDDHQLVITTTFVRNIPDWEPPSGGSRIVLEFFVDGRDAVDAKYAELTEAGYHGRREPFLTSFDAWMCVIDDPDGNTVLVTAG
jgi:catechol 2,3-dioxygenase-like lactoylglutathione lyase family enzyme